MAMTLKEILSDLRSGGTLVLATTDNRYGEKIITSELSYDCIHMTRLPDGGDK